MKGIGTDLGAGTAEERRRVKEHTKGAGERAFVVCDEMDRYMHVK